LDSLNLSRGQSSRERRTGVAPVSNLSFFSQRQAGSLSYN
jgi:hypothetical protein